MSKVIVHATITLDGYLADPDGGVGWMFDFPTADDDYGVVDNVLGNLGAVVGGANKTRTIEDGEEPYGGNPPVPVFLMTHTPAEPLVKGDRTYTFVVDDIARAVELAREAAGEKWVSVLGGSVSRQCLRLGLVDELHLDVVPVLLGEGISLFGGLGMRVDLERLHTSAFASETHLIYRVVR